MRTMTKRIVLTAFALVVVASAGVGYWQYSEWRTDAEWQRALEVDTIRGYETYLANNPADERRKPNAQTRIAQLSAIQKTLSYRSRRVARKLQTLFDDVHGLLQRIEDGTDTPTDAEVDPVLSRVPEDLMMHAEIVRGLLLESGLLDALATRLEAAEALFARGAYAEVANALDELDQEHDLIVGSLTVVAELARQRNDALRERETWDALRNQKGIPHFDLLEELESMHARADGLLLDPRSLKAAGDAYVAVGKELAALTASATEVDRTRQLALSQQRRWKNLVAENELDSRIDQDLVTEYSLAESLWTAGRFEQAGPDFDAVRTSYTQLDREVSEAFQAERVAAGLQGRWAAFAREESLDVGHGAHIGEELDRARLSLRQGDFDTAIGGFDRVRGSFSTLVSQAEKAVDAFAYVRPLEEEWQAIVERRWAFASTGRAAEAELNDARRHRREGAYGQATAALRQVGAALSDLIARAKSNRREYELAVTQWREENKRIGSKVSGLERTMARLDATIQESERQSNRNCSEGGGFLEALAEGLEGASCVLNCTESVFNGVFVEQRTNQNCVNRCERELANRAREQRRRVERCLDEVERAEARHREATTQKGRIAREFRELRHLHAQSKQNPPEFHPI